MPRAGADPFENLERAPMGRLGVEHGLERMAVDLRDSRENFQLFGETAGLEILAGLEARPVDRCVVEYRSRGISRGPIAEAGPVPIAGEARRGA